MKRLLAVVAAFALAYLAWPLWSAWQLRQAIRARDLASLETRVDWTVLRANLKPRLANAVRENAEASTGMTGVLKRAVGAAVVEHSVDLVVTPKNLARVLAGREFVLARTKEPPAPQKPQQNDPGLPTAQDADDPQDPVPPKRLRWAFFETPARFRIEAEHPRIPGSRIVSILELRGIDWKLVDVDLVALGTR